MEAKPLESLPLPSLVRYGLTGIVGVALFFVVPIAILKPGTFSGLATLGGVSGLFLAGIVTGFLLDALKVYQFTYRYKSRRDAFMGDLAASLGVERTKASFYFSKCVQLEKTKSDGTIHFQHSRWAMMTICSLLFLLAGVVWLLAGSVYIAEHIEAVAFRFFAAALVALILGWRLTLTSMEERTKVNRAYLYFCSENRERILRPTAVKFEKAGGDPRMTGDASTVPGSSDG